MTQSEQSQEREEPRECTQCLGRALIHWHPYWDNGHHPCPACRPGEYAAWKAR